MKLSTELQISINVALNEGARRHHEYASVEHLLYALLHDDQSIDALNHCGADIETIKQELDTFLATQIEELPVDSPFQVQPSLGFQRVISQAAIHVQSAGRGEVMGTHVLVAMFAEPDSHAAHFLEKQGVERLALVSYLSHGAPGTEDPSGTEYHSDDERLDNDNHSGKPTYEEGGRGKPDKNPLTLYTTNLNQLAKEERIDPLIGRTKEIQRILHILSRRNKNNPVLVGDSGVGKTAIVDGLALKIHEGDVPDAFINAILYNLDLGGMLAGTRYRGDFESRVKGVLDELENKPEAILIIDEMHTIVGAGSVTGSVMDASSLLKPALAKGRLRCIGMTTHKDYRTHIEKDRAFARRFQKVDIDEPSLEETIKILEGLKQRYEEHHDVAYTKTALSTAASLSQRYLQDKRLPDKAIDLLDETGAAAHLAGRSGARIGPKEIEKTLATMAQIPSKRVGKNDKELLRNLDQELKKVVFGQDHAIEKLSVAIKLCRAGLRAPEKPMGAYLFTGPTGVGKTEVARQLARILGVEFLRFDMSEYMERHTVSRLIGAPPGYVGFDQGGLMTEAVNKTPHAVLLLDEIEKAHPDVFNLLLQIMDHGSLTDTNGKKTDFRHVILLMTSNVGSRELAQQSVGFSTKPSSQGDDKAYKRMFSPEFRNRLDARVSFVHLTEGVILQIVEKFMDEMREQLKERKVTIELTDSARNYLAKKGYDPTYGARPLARLIQEEIKRLLGEEILFGKLEKGGHVAVKYTDNKLDFDFT